MTMAIQRHVAVDDAYAMQMQNGFGLFIKRGTTVEEIGCFRIKSETCYFELHPTDLSFYILDGQKFRRLKVGYKLFFGIGEPLQFGLGNRRQIYDYFEVVWRDDYAQTS